MNTDQTKMQKYQDMQAMVQKEIKTQFPGLFKKYSEQFGVAKEVPFHLHTGLDSPQIMQSSIIASQGASGSITMATNGQRYVIGLNTKPGSSFAPSKIRFNGIAVYQTASFSISSSTVSSGAVYQVSGLSFTVLTSISPGTTLSTEGPGSALSISSGTLTKVSGTGPSTIHFSAVTATSTIRALIEGDAFLGPSFYLQPFSSTAVTTGGPGQVIVQSSSYILVNDSGSGPLTQASVSEGHVVSVTFNGVIVARATFPDLGDFGANELPIQSGCLQIDVTLVSGWQIIGNFLIT